MRFSRRITLSILAIVAGTSIIGAVIARQQVRRAEADGVSAVFDLEARSIRERQALRLEATRQAIGQLDTNSFLFGALVEEDWADLYANAEYELRALRALDAHFLDAAGRPVARPGSEPTPLARAIDTSALPVQDEPLDQPARPICVLQDGLLVEALRQPVVDVTTGDPVGWIVAAWPWTWPERTDRTAGSETLYAVLVDGRVALPPGQAMEEWLAQAMPPISTTDGAELESPSGEPFLVRSFPIEGALRTPARFMVLRSLAASRAAERRTNAFFLGTAILAIAAGGAVSQWMGRSLSRPVQQLGDAARLIGHGDYSIRVAVAGADDTASASRRPVERANTLVSAMRTRRFNVASVCPRAVRAGCWLRNQTKLWNRSCEALCGLWESWACKLNSSTPSLSDISARTQSTTVRGAIAWHCEPHSWLWPPSRHAAVAHAELQYRSSLQPRQRMAVRAWQSGRKQKWQCER
jgi:hypothetical protein